MKTIENKRIRLLLAIAVLCGAVGCGDKEFGPISESLGKPGKVEVLSADSTIPGGIVINYRIPQTNDIIEVKAVYALTNGRTLEESTSFYTSYLTLQGFNDTLEHEAKLYVINRAREASDPVTVTFRPGESSLSKATKSMNITADFGGVNYSWRNPDKSMLFFEFFTEDSLGQMVTLNIISSKSDSAGISFRGYDTIPRKFAVSVRDNWGNSSAMLYPDGGTVLPMPEFKLDKTKMKMMRLAGDSNWENWGGSDAYLIDDDPDTFGHTQNEPAGGVFTLDFGSPVKMSRMLMFQRSVAYYQGQPCAWEIYTTNETGAAPSADWSAWEFAAVIRVYKPSGAPLGQNTPDDLVAARNGLEASVPLEVKPSRYIRFHFIEQFNPSNMMYCPTEFTFYGYYVK
jgi:hypothetical protein